MQIPKVPDAEKQNKKPQSVENVPIYTIIHQTSYFHWTTKFWVSIN